MKSGSIFMIFMLLLYLAGNLYIFLRSWQALPWHNMAIRITIIVVAIFLVLSMFFAFIGINHLPQAVISFLYRVGSSWMIIFLYGFMFLLLRDIFLFTEKQWHFLPASLSDTTIRWGSYLLTVGITAIVLFSGYINYCSKKRVELTIETGNPNLTKEMKIVALSDLHLGYSIGNRELSHWIKLINAEKPDIVLIAGDIIDNSVNPLEKESMDLLLKKIKSRMGVYACPGNHEYISKIERSIPFIKKSNVNLLRDSAVLIKNRLYIVGRDDRMNRSRASIKDLLEPLDRTKPVILLDHQPYHLEEAAENGVTLQLSGHTHRGQVWPLTWVTDRIYELSHGYLQKRDTHYYVSSGIGLWGGKFRIGSRSEYAVITLK